MESKIKKAFQTAYDGYVKSCNRYNNLVAAYKVLRKFEPDKPLGKGFEARFPYTAKIIHQIIHEANVTKNLIADSAKECAKYRIAS